MIEPVLPRPQPHIAIVSYLFPPADVSGVRRAAALREALRGLGFRTTVITSTVSGRLPDDAERGVVRAADARTRLASRHHRPGASFAPWPAGVGRRRWFTRLFVPDVTAASWGPSAALAALRLARSDRPDAVFTTSPPESVHLVGLALGRRGMPWIADLRDGWTFEPPTPRPYASRLDRALENRVVRRASIVTAVTEPLVEDLRNRYGEGDRVVHLPNGYDPDAVAAAGDGRSLVDPERFSLVYTGSGAVDGKDPSAFLRVLERAVAERPALRNRLEVLFAGNLTGAEVARLGANGLSGLTRYVGWLDHRRALGLQRAADGLLLITAPGLEHVATGKVYEYLIARKPILALADGNSAAGLLELAGGHVTAPPEDEEAITAALDRYLDRWADSSAPYAPDPCFEIEAYSFHRIGERLADLLVQLGVPRP